MVAGDGSPPFAGQRVVSPLRVVSARGLTTLVAGLPIQWLRALGSTRKRLCLGFLRVGPGCLHSLTSIAFYWVRVASPTQIKCGRSWYKDVNTQGREISHHPPHCTKGKDRVFIWQGITVAFVRGTQPCVPWFNSVTWEDSWDVPLCFQIKGNYLFATMLGCHASQQTFSISASKPAGFGFLQTLDELWGAMNCLKLCLKHCTWACVCAPWEGIPSFP